MKKFVIHFIAGARPNFMKIAPIVKAMERRQQEGEGRVNNFQVKIVHTGQHYDKNMSEVFFRELGIPEPDYNLEVGSGSHAEQTGNVMMAFEKILLKDRPDLVVVVGDVNSTIACSLTAKKLGIRVAHVEAGLRSFDMEMPEEINRILTDRISDLLFVTEESGITNLKNEGVSEDRIHFVGNVMIDTLMSNLEKLDGEEYEVSPAVGNFIGENIDYGVMTLHRPSNVDDKDVFLRIWAAVQEIGSKIPILFPVHPRTRARMSDFGFKPDGVQLIDPIGYMDMLSAFRKAKLVLTDSGGLQEETTYLGVPCITIRENTERPSTIEIGTNYLAGTDPDKICSIANEILEGRGKKGQIPPLWDGKAAERIVEVLVNGNIFSWK